jgi:hypothetical protein
MKKYRDEIAAICHEIVKDGYDLGLINDAEMKEFEENAFDSEPEPDREVPKPVHAASAT